MPSGSGVRGRQASGSASSSGSADNSSGRIFKPKPISNRDRADLAWTQKIERIAECKVIRFPRPIIYLNDDERPEFTVTHQVYMMRALLKNNGVDLSQFSSTTPATDDEKRALELSIARAYNSTIAEQKRKIINQYKRAPRFTFSYLEPCCYPICKFRGFACGQGNELFIGCTSHDLVKYPDEEGYGNVHGYGVEARYALNTSHLGLMPDSALEYVPRFVRSVCQSMSEIDESLDYISLKPRTASEEFGDKFMALDAQYKKGCLPRLNEARMTIAESFLSRQEELAKWVKRMKGT